VVASDVKSTLVEVEELVRLNGGFGEHVDGAHAVHLGRRESKRVVRSLPSGSLINLVWSINVLQKEKLESRTGKPVPGRCATILEER
jgi:hypothetical protein